MEYNFFNEQNFLKHTCPNLSKWRRENVRFQLDTLFRRIELSGKRVLDVGGGSGIHSLYAGCRGAKEVICLEPEAAGSTSEASRGFQQARAVLGCRNVSLHPTPFQDYDSGGRTFDLILMLNSVNHLDEEACMHLQESEDSRRIYMAIFANLRSCCSPGTKLIISDAARRNFFGDLGVRSPIARTIEWKKHQAPEVWIRLLRDAGFDRPRVHWSSLKSLRELGRLLTANRWASYFTTSHFTLTMEAS